MEINWKFDWKRKVKTENRQLESEHLKLDDGKRKVKVRFNLN